MKETILTTKNPKTLNPNPDMPELKIESPEADEECLLK
jgi:hypothetical protein